MNKLISLFLALTSVQALNAQTTDAMLPNTISSAALSVGKVAEAVKPDRISYFSIFSGPSLGRFSDPVDETGTLDEGSISTWSQVSFQWNINDNLRFLVNPRFVLNHNGEEAKENPIEWDEPVFGVAGTWVQRGNFSIGGGLNTVLPYIRTNSMKNDGVILNPGGFQFASYRLNSKFSIDTQFWARAFIYDRTAPTGENRASYLFAPQFTYNINDSMQAIAFYQFNGDLDREYSHKLLEDDSLNLQFSWTLNKYVTVQPLITMFRESNFDIKNSNFNLWLSGRLF